MTNLCTLPNVYEKWEGFVKGGIDLSGLRKEIASSWLRSRSFQIDPFAVFPEVDPATVPKLLENNLYLIEVVRKYIDLICPFIIGTGFIVTLTDGKGMVLEITGDANVIEKAQRNNFVIGANRSERAIGTNAIGLAIVEKKPVQIIGPEHYNIHSHSWTCSAAPIHDSEGNVVGVFNVSGDYTLSHRHTLGMIASIVHAIEPELHIQVANRLKNGSNRKKEDCSYFSFEDIVGSSKKMSHAIEIAKMVAETDSRVLLEGESGTGKELFAQSIHNASNRRYGPFIAINCSAIPHELIESELFGYSDGAFTGAKKGGKPGKFELAAGGTIFLDEINSMPLDMQVKLLRVLQQNEITRIGATDSTPINVRVIAASNESLENLAEEGKFRSDLYYRLSVVTIQIPSLRERDDDIPLLFHYLLDKICKKLGNKRIKKWDEGLLKAMRSYDWPGNVRELENYIERAVILTANEELTLQHFPKKILENSSYCSTHEIRALEKMERDSIANALEEFDWNITKASKHLGIARNTLYSKIKIYNLNEKKCM